MAYKKYVKRGDKVFGPYYYESYRDSSGKVCKKYVGTTDPAKKKSGNTKNFNKIFLTLTIVLISVFGLLFFVSNSGIVGNVILGEESIEQRFVIDNSSLEIKAPSALAKNVAAKNKNKRMDFDIGGANLRLYFDLLNYSEFVDEVEEIIESEGSLITGLAIRGEKNITLKKVKEKVKDLDLSELEKIKDEVVVEARDFDIEVIESEDVDYKWGYEVRLDDLNFMAKIDVTSEEEILVLSNSSLKIGNSILSFADLAAEGYSVRIERPALDIIEEVVVVVNETLEVVNETIELINETEEIVNETIEPINETVEPVNETVEPINETVEPVNETIEPVNETVEPVNETVEPVNETIETVVEIEETVNETVESVAEEVVEEVIPEEEVVEEVIPEEEVVEEVISEEEVVEEVVEEEVPTEEPEEAGITGNLIRGLVGFVVSGAEDLEYENSITVYIERDFSGSEYEVGDIIMLDPTLNIIEITKAEHLDSERIFVSDIYDDVKTLDGNWSSVIGDGEYVRVTFEAALDDTKDITVYSRGNGSLEVYEKDGVELIADFGEMIEGKNVVLLTGFVGAQDVFDLKVVDGSLEFDWIVDPMPVINWSRINAPLYDTASPEAEAFYSDPDSDVGTLYFEWFVNSVSVENDTVGGVVSGTSVKTYLDFGISAGDVVNMTVFAGDGTSNSSVKNLQHVILGLGGEAAARPYIGNTEALFCDDTYCYGAHGTGHITKTYKNGTVVFGEGGTEGAAIQSTTWETFDIFCDDTYCYGGHDYGYLTKIYKNGTIAIGTGGTESVAIRPSTEDMNAIFCDDTYCYGGHAAGYFTKTYKNGTVVFGDSGIEGVAIQPYTLTIYDITCDDTYCYAVHQSGYFTKIFKNGTVAIGDGGTESAVVRPDTINAYSIFCDDTYCYGGHSSGQFTKTNKNGTIVLGTGGSEGLEVKPFSQAINGLYCDDTYCYAAHNLGSITKLYKNGTFVWGNAGIESERIILDAENSMKDVFCDDTYCYGGHNGGYFTKVSMSSAITVLALPSIVDIVYPKDKGVTSYSSYPTEINYTVTEPDLDMCWYNAGYGNSTAVSCGTNFTNVQYNAPSYGDVTLTVYGNDSSGNVGSVNVTFTKNNSLPSVGSVSTPASVQSNESVTCSYDITDSDYFIKYGANGVEGGSVFPYTGYMYAITCDDTYCYGAHASGRLTKFHKNGTIVWGTGGTEGAAVVADGNTMNGIFCDDTYCYGAYNNGYFTKTYKNGTIVLGTGGTEGAAVRPDTNLMYATTCDDTYCYQAYNLGYLTKTYKNGTIALGIGGTEGTAVQPHTSLMNGIFCDDTYCYGAHTSGYLTKTYKNGTVVWGTGGTEGAALRPNTNTMYAVTCDDTYCYIGHRSGYLTKIYKNGTIVLGTGGTEGAAAQPSASYMYGISCDDTYCYGAHRDGYLTKTYKNGTVVWGTGGTERGALLVNTNTMRGLSCDDVYCYGAHSDGSFIKVEMGSGDMSLDVNVTWYKDAVPTVSSVLTGRSPGVTLSTVLSSSETSKGEDWTCEIIPYDGTTYGVAASSLDTSITNTPPIIDQPDMLIPLYDFMLPALTISYFDSDSDNGTLYFEWFVNSVSVENDSVGGVVSGTSATAYLNYGVSVGDAVSVLYFGGDGTVNTSLSPLDYVVFGTGGATAPRPHTTVANEVFCDDTYCYYAHTSGYLTKVYKNGTIAIGDGGTESEEILPYTISMFSIFCDDTYCYGAHDDGYFTKTYKNGTVAIGNGGTESEEVIIVTGSDINGIFCDDTYCYGAHKNGYFTKVYKNGTIAIGDGGTESELVAPNTQNAYAIDCDDTYCYTSYNSGYITKVYKNGTIVWGTGGTEGAAVRPSTSAVYAISCDDTYCYGGHSSGYFTKIYKNGTVVIGTGGTESGQVRPDTNTLWDLSCDDTYCYGAHSSGYFTKTYKNGTIVLGTGGIEGAALNTDTNNMNAIFCDDTYCYGAHNNGYTTKVMTSLSVTVLASPAITSLDNPVNGSFETTDTVFGFTPTFGSALSECELWGDWNGGWHVNQTLSSVSVDVNNNFNALNISDGSYDWNVRCSDGNIWGGFNSVNYTLTVDTIGPVLNVVYPQNSSVTSYADYPSEINYSMVEANPDMCWYNAGLGNLTFVSCGTNFTNLQYNSPSYGDVTWTIYGNDSAGNVGSVNVTFTKNNTLPVASNIVTNASVQSSEDISCSFDFDDSDYIVKLGIGGVDGGASVLLNNLDMYGIYCDDTYCYGAMESGYFTKMHKNGTVAIGTSGTESGVIRPDTNRMNDIYCDDTYCYSGHLSGYFTKTYKNGTIAIGTDGTESAVIRPDTTHINSITCDDTYCYGAHDNGYFTKTYKNGTIVIGTGGTESEVIRPLSWDFYAISCDDTYCYGAHDAGFFSKTYKNGTIVIGTGGTEAASARPSGSDTRGLYCDDIYCYGGHTDGSFSKAYKNGTIIIGLSGTQSAAINLNSNAVYGMGCDDTYCYAGHLGGYLTKVHKNGTVIWGTGGTESEAIRPDTNHGLTIFCDDFYCYTGTSLGHVTKVEKDSGDTSFEANLTWYKDAVPTLSSVLTDIAQGSTISVLLGSGNISRGENWTCEIDPYDGSVYGATATSLDTTVVNGVPILSQFGVVAPIYDSVTPEAAATYFDGDLDVGTLSFEWFVNSVSVENDSIGGVASGTATTAYLNYGVVAGDIINVTVFAWDGFVNTGLSLLQQIILGIGGGASPRPHTTTINGITCDNTYCYGGHTSGYFTKSYKNGTVVIGDGGSESEVVKPSTWDIYDIDCDDTYCYSAVQYGYFTKTYKNGTIVIGIGGTESSEKRVDIQTMFAITCDDTYCYGGHDTGYFTKTYKNGTIAIGSGGTESASIRTYSSDIQDISCDDTYCYFAHDGGYFSKINKNGTIAIGTGGTESEVVRPYTNHMYKLDCDDTYCYGAHLSGYFTKTNKNGTIVIGTGGTEIGLMRPYTFNMFSISCDDTYCYGGHSTGYFTKTNKNGTVAIGTGGTESSVLQISTYNTEDITCDDTYCYGAYSLGYTTKVLTSLDITVLASPAITSLDNPTDGSFETTDVVFGFTPTFDAVLSECELWGEWNGGWHANQTLSSVAVDVGSNFSALNMSDGSYAWNVRCSDGSIWGGFNSVNYTVIVDNTNPVLTLNSPADNNWGDNSTVDFNFTVIDENIESCTLYHNASGSWQGNETNNSIVNNSVDIMSMDFSDGNYLWNVLCNDSAGNQAYNSVNYTVNVDTIFPTIEYSSGTENNDSHFSRDWLYVNVSVVETNFVNVTFRLFNSSGQVNVTTFTTSDFDINWSLGSDGLYYYNVSVADITGKVNSTITRIFNKDTVSPVVVRYDEGMPAADSVGGESVYYNWSVTDNQDDNLTCYTMMDSVQMGTYYVANGTSFFENEVLIGGPHSLYVRCFDNANNYADSSSVIYLVAVINMTNPSVSGTVYRAGDVTSFAVDEISGTDFLDAASISISNSNAEAKYFYLNTVGDSHTGNYVWTGEPGYVTIDAWSFKTAVGENQNATDSITGVFLRAEGNTSVPVIESACPNETYVVNGTTIDIELVADLDTLILSENMVIVAPDNMSYTLAYENSSINGAGYINSYNYSFVANKSGNYRIVASVTDYENQTTNWTYGISSSASSFSTYKINSSTFQYMSWDRKCTGVRTTEGSEMTFVLTDEALVDLRTKTVDLLHNITLDFRDVNLTGDIFEAVSYREMSDEVAAPSGKRRVALFELNSTMQFSNYTFTYDYGSIAHTFTNESALKLYKCDNVSSCVLVEIASVLNESANQLIAYDLVNFSYFMITEDEVAGETVVETVTTSGGTTTRTVYRSLNIITPGDVEIGLTDQIVIPVVLSNPENIALKKISLAANSSTTDIDPVFEDVDIDVLEAGENKTVMLFLESHSLPGEYEVHITAEVESPSFVETAIIYVRLVQSPGLSVIVERIVLAQDLFRENPQCLELNDLLIEAQRLIDEGEIERAKIIVQETIYKCKDLVAAKEFPLNLTKIKEWKTPVMVSLGLIILALIISVIIRKPKIDLYKARKKKKKSWFSFGRKSK